MKSLKFTAGLVMINLMVMAINGYCKPLEFNLRRGEYCFIFVHEPGKAESLVPIRDIAYLNRSFEDRDACFSVEVMEDGSLREFVVKGWLDGFRQHGFSDRRPMSQDAFAHFELGGDIDFGKVAFFVDKDITIISEQFSDKKTDRKFEIGIYIAKDKEAISKRVDIPKKYVAFSWLFQDPFDVMEPFKSRFKSKTLE